MGAEVDDGDHDDDHVMMVIVVIVLLVMLVDRKMNEKQEEYRGITPVCNLSLTVFNYDTRF